MITLRNRNILELLLCSALVLFVISCRGKKTGEIIGPEASGIDTIKEKSEDYITSYYKICKVIGSDGSENTSVSGGQFLTFSENLLFESDKTGCSVGNGVLEKNQSESSDKVLKYEGGSYWSANSKFVFTNEMRTLHIILNDGRILVGKKMNAPSDATTCSYISENAVPIDIVQNNPPTMGNTSIQNQKKGRYIQVECHCCHGQKTIVQHTHGSWYGVDEPKKVCPVCGELCYSDHYHATCPICHGKGTVERYVID